jgi:hypothetical protein
MALIPFTIRFNAALAAMNIRPDAFTSDQRVKVQTFAKAVKLTPQEGAFYLASFLPNTRLPDAVETALVVWRQEGKLNLEKPEIRESLDRMGYGGF